MGLMSLGARWQIKNPTTIHARDSFDQTAGALTGKTLPVGGTWQGSGNATDFALDTTNHVVTRASISDDWVMIGRLVLADVTDYVAAAVQVGFSSTAIPVSHRAHLIGRYVDANNFLLLTLYSSSGAVTLGRVTASSAGSGSMTEIAYTTIAPLAPNTRRTAHMQVDAAGVVAVWVWDGAAPPLEPTLIGYNADLVTAGALQNGQFGFSDINPSTTACTRSYDEFSLAALTPDAAMFASQSLELRHDRARRENAAGTVYNDVSSRRGTYLRVLPAGREGRSTRFVVKPYRNDPATVRDGGIDDVSAQLFVTPRGLAVPE